uniref:Ig-like domain-containing protein n=1 Tax=Accipiter nisus TaxID=211598 RepID=A0A8B9ML40_9AVES
HDITWYGIPLWPVCRYDGKNKMEKQDERYQGRTEFFHSEFRAGNMSLHLKNVRSSDKGSYTCVVSFNDTYHDVLIELQVAGGVPSIFLRSHMKQGIGLTCHAVGWFPKPEVIWLDGQGHVRKELSTTKMTMMPAGLYSVVTSMNLNPGSDMEVSCRIVNNLSGMGIKVLCKALGEVPFGMASRNPRTLSVEVLGKRKQEKANVGNILNLILLLDLHTILSRLNQTFIESN